MAFASLAVFTSLVVILIMALLRLDARDGAVADVARFLRPIIATTDGAVLATHWWWRWIANGD